MKIIVFVIIVLLMVVGYGVVQAQENKSTDMTSGFSDSCVDREIQELQAATDYRDSNQEAHLRSAEAYHKLSIVGATC